MGHGRTYFIADVLARFKRMQGYNVLFPMGFHYTGTPIIAMAERVASGDKQFIEVLIKRFDVPPEIVDKMKDPLYMARYFHESSKRVFDEYGLSIDWRREFTTIDPEFKAFIHWQFKKLASKGYIERGSHPVGWCPKHEMPVGAHDTSGDVEPDIGEFTAILFKLIDAENTYLPTATLRPETVFGVTNIWINPDEEYVLIELDSGIKLIVGSKAAERLRYQIKFRILKNFKGSELIGLKVENPITGEEIPVLPATFVDTSFATGVVMSVPAHAPYDAAALEDLKKGLVEIPEKLKEIVSTISPRMIISVEGFTTYPAYEALTKYGVESQDDRTKLDEATKFIYSTELRSGYMLSNLHEVVPMKTPEIRNYVANYVTGKSVAEARENIKKFLLDKKMAFIVYELLNKPVYCRCGSEIVVKILENQWFINYGKEDWKELAYKALSKMKIVPEEVRAQFKATIDWLRRRACARTRGLGVPLPWDPTWIIESLSDSTIYMAFYTVIHKIRQYRIPSDKLTEEFWDYVFLGRGSSEYLEKKLGIPAQYIEDIRREFTYWYPLDWRVSGKDLIPNHLTFFIFNHAAIFSEDLWPKGIIANGWVLLRGGKMSKSRGNIVLLRDLVDTWGSDTVRLAMGIGAEVPQDFEISDDLLNEALATLKSIHDLLDKLINEIKKASRDCTSLIDRWFLSKFYETVDRTTRYLDEVRIRTSAIEIFYNIPNLIREYLSYTDTPCRDIVNIVEDWIKMLAPYTPFIAEELWHRLGKKGFVVIESWPKPRFIDREAILAMEFIKHLIDDIKNVLKVVKVKPKRLVVYVYPRSAYEVLRIAIEKGERGIREIGSKLVEIGIPKDKAFTIAQRIVKNVRELDENTKNLLMTTDIDEYSVLSELRDIVKTATGIDVVDVYRVDDVSAPDYRGKKFSGTPFKPGIYLET